MSSRIRVCLIYFIGILLSILAISSDVLRGRPYYLGFTQITLLILGITLIVFGVLINRGVLTFPLECLRKTFYQLFSGIKCLFSTIFHVFSVFLKSKERALPLRSPLTILLILGILILLYFPIKFIIGYASSPNMMEYRDAAAVSTAIDFARGVNPYELKNFPHNMYLYGPLYPLFLSPFINIGQHPLKVVKFIDLIFLILFLGLSYWILRKKKASVISSLIGILILMNSVCYIWRFNGARPDLTGLFFALVIFYFMMKKKPNIANILLCAFLCVISFYFKKYMVFSALIMAVYLFLFVSKRHGLWFVISGLSIAVGSYFLINLLFPIYFEVSFLQLSQEVVYDQTWMARQTATFLQYFWILWIFYVFYILQAVPSFWINKRKGIRLVLTKNDAPLISGVQVDIFDIGILISVVILTTVLGGHTGNWIIYYLQLLLPFLVYMVIPKLDELEPLHWRRAILQMSILLFCVYPFHQHYETDFLYNTAKFKELSKLANQCSNIYNETPLVALYKLEHNMYPIQNNGHTDYLKQVVISDSLLLGWMSDYTTEDFSQQLDDWNRMIRHGIDKQEFDCIFVDSMIEMENYHLDGYVKKVLRRTVSRFLPN